MEDPDKQTKDIPNLKILIFAIFACAIIITGIYFVTFQSPKTYEKDAQEYVLDVDILDDWTLTNENISSEPAYDGIVSSWQRYFIKDNNNLSIRIIVCKNASFVQELMEMDKLTLEYLGDISSNDIGSDGFTAYYASEYIPEFDHKLKRRYAWRWDNYCAGGGSKLADQQSVPHT